MQKHFRPDWEMHFKPIFMLKILNFFLTAPTHAGVPSVPLKYIVDFFNVMPKNSGYDIVPIKKLTLGMFQA